MQNVEMNRRVRNPALEKDEREAFVLLQHIHSHCGGHPFRTLRLEQLARELAYDDHTAARLCELLVWGKFVNSGAGVVSLTAEGAEYISWRAGRRRSARLGEWAETFRRQAS